MNDEPRTSIEPALEASTLGALPRQARESLTLGARYVSAPPGTVIYRPNDPVRVMLVDRGLARLKVLSPDGRAATVHLANQGHILGLTTLFGGSPTVAADAVTHLGFWDLDVARFQHAAHTQVQVAYLLAQSMASATAEMIELTSVNIFGSVRQRVSRQLLDLAENVNGHFVVRAGQQEIASGIGSVREVVARAIRGLKEEGLCERVPDGLRIIDPAAVHRIAYDAR
ncbi:Crp/Fnr family transcriptional regulator [Mycolicibacterium sp. P9-64]|uniref:Crp/Fnr family transcriptional regulator n=1 Tax=Mycolicibacterium sp. P9-64 TaxID=2024612 RepID=UPI0015655D18|nr:Crp/Fnr family transcriptional regulator [Mycolicibacterium sp. P9-64]